MAQTVRLCDLAARVGGRVIGDGEFPVAGVASLAEAGPTDLSFLTSSSARYRREAAESRAGAVLVAEADAAALATLDPTRPLLVVADANTARSAVLAHVYPPPPPAPGIHPSAAINPSVHLPASLEVGPYAVVGAGCEFGERVRIGAHVVIGRGCRLGDDVVLHPHVVLYDHTQLAARVTIHAGTVVGADGFGYVSDARGHHKVPQVGRVEVGDDVEIGANSTIDRATLGATRIGSGSKIDNLVQVGHNVQVGRAALLCGQAGIAGSSRLGDGVVLAGQAGVSGHLSLGDGVMVGAASAAVRDAAPKEVLSATLPAMPVARWRRIVALLPRLDEWFRRLRVVERELGISAGSKTPAVDKEGEL